MAELSSIRIVRADYTNPVHASAVVELLDAYARDPMGGAEPLSQFAKDHLIASMATRAQIFSVLAFAPDDDAAERPVGLVNCVEGFSTFACQPLVNIHDLAVLPAYRGQGVAARMLALVEQIAAGRGACKLTLEVLAGNVAATRLYRRTGFDNYQMDPALGDARFLQKWLVIHGQAIGPGQTVQAADPNFGD